MKFGSWTFNGDQVVLSWYEGQEKVRMVAIFYFVKYRVRFVVSVSEKQESIKFNEKHSK